MQGFKICNHVDWKYSSHKDNENPNNGSYFWLRKWNDLHNCTVHQILWCIFKTTQKDIFPLFATAFPPNFTAPFFPCENTQQKRGAFSSLRVLRPNTKGKKKLLGVPKKRERKKAKLPLRRNERTFRSAAVDSCVFAQIWATTTTDVSQRSRTNIRPDYCFRRLFIIIAESGIHGQNQQSFPFQIVSQWDFLGDRPALNPPKLFIWDLSIS